MRQLHIGLTGGICNYESWLCLW